ncbi:molybdopterin-binding protein [Roseivirga sp. E12]|uniref:TOBE domain-containing protein n=1 Tax=Roseivirga sp. E12 TaxID=2819237 RepID=UPI001ABCC2BD|nr:TOBE domain-containing protein [Roseivirga sp. E12]MBO3697470.1 TOBE domain-containing protein [Roseivirga sp. E12]
MNSIQGKISAIQTSGSLSLVSIEAGPNKLTTIVIDTPETLPLLKVGNTVKAIFKETEVAIGTEEKHNISMQNQLLGLIKGIEVSELLTKVVIQIGTTEVSSIITTKAANAMNLIQGMPVTALIKTNEIMLSE